MVTVSKTISIPNEDLLDDTTPSVARKFLNEVQNSLVTLQRVVKQKMILEVHNWLSSAHKEVHKIISYEIAPIINQVDARVQNFETQFLQKADKFVRDFKSLANESDESLDKQKSLELEIERLLKASVSHDIMSIVQNGFVDVPSDLQTELDRMKEKLKLRIIKKEKEYAALWNKWYTKCEECKYDKISYDKAYNDMQQKFKRLQAQLRNLKGKSSDTPSTSNTLDPLNQKLDSKIVELEFQVVNYEREISHLKTTYKNLFDSITSNRAHAKLYNLIYKNAKLRARLFENTSESMNNTSGTSVTPQVDTPKLIAVPPYSKKLHASIPSHSVPQPREFNVVKHSNVIATGMFKINPPQTSRENVSSDTVNASSTGLVHTDRTRRPPPKGNTKNARAPSASKSSEVKKNVIVEDHRRILLLSKNQKTMSSECNNIKLAIRNNKYDIVCGTYKQCLVTANHDACLLSPVNALNSHHMTGNIKLLINFVWKFLGTVRFGNNHIAAILAYSDLKWGNITITRVYFVEGLGHNLFSVGQFCDADLEVAFRRNTCFIRDLYGVDLLKGNRSTNLYTINLYDMASASPLCLMACVTLSKSWLWHQRLSHLNFDTINDLAKMISSLVYQSLNILKNIFVPLVSKEKEKEPLTTQTYSEFKAAASSASYRFVWSNEYFDSVSITHETFAAKTPQQNGVVECRNRTLVEAARTMLIFSHAPLFLWAEAIAIACYTQNRSIIHRCFNKTPYELIQGRKPEISYLHVFGALCYPKNDREDIGKLGAKGDIGSFIGYSSNFVAYRVYNRRTAKIMKTMNVTFDELSAMAFEQNSSRHGLQSLTSGQISSELKLTYVPSIITPQKPSEHHLDILFEPLHNEYLGGRPSKAPRTIPDAPVIQNLQAPTASMNTVFEGDLFVNPFATPSTESVVFSTQYVDPSNMHTFYQPYLHDYQWTKDHPLEQVIGEPSRPVLTRSQLKTDGDMCIYALTVSIMEPKSVKEALTDLAWIESMQEELHQFIRIDVWELVPSPDGIKPLTLKWLFKNKHDEENTVIRNKTRLVDSGFKLTRFSDADYAGCKDTFKSTSGGAQFLGKKLVNWPSKKQDCTSLSTLESEYVSLSACCAQVLWMQTQLKDYGYHFDKILIYCDSKSAIVISCNPVQHSRTKHILIPFHQGARRKGQSGRDLPKDTPIDRLEVLRTQSSKVLEPLHTVKSGNNLRVLRIILVIMPEHQSDISMIFTMTMEILLEPTSSKLLVGDVGDSVWIELVTLDINFGP
nr:integrase, catalytic region, zinc finger, CCHC-type, peptidase aspartic, catalytic [Tanacetum cinerariifolium]